MIWFFKSKQQKLADKIKKNGEIWAEIRQSLNTYTQMLETTQRNIELLKNGADKDRYAQEEIKRKGLIKKIDELKKLENKISEKVAKINGELDHDPKYK
jgi:hypothetical protein